MTAEPERMAAKPPPRNSFNLSTLPCSLMFRPRLELLAQGAFQRFSEPEFTLYSCLRCLPEGLRSASRSEPAWGQGRKARAGSLQ